MMRVGLLFYGVMGIVGLGLVAWRRGELHLFDPAALPGADWAWWAGVALALVLVVHVMTRVGLRYSAALRRAADDVRERFGELGPSRLWALAALSGTVEELVFRGWLLNEVGLVVSSVIFGIVHVPPARHWFAWPIFAAAVGFAFGGLCLGSGTLVFAILAHAGINGANLALLARADRGIP
ncbi:MAG TPA: CPBP family intramembrane metalloprotease [Verrucomicrobiae bacterium]|nr:CPBP family intramembrane metalloprotease [Verrucomicrobiae bacterium]